MSKWVNYSKKILSDLRLNKVWKYKFPVLIAVPLWVLSASNEPPWTIVGSLACSLMTILGIGGLAYLFNDYSDLKKDIEAGKNNFFSGNKRKLSIFIAGFSLIAFLPWVYLPLDQFSLFLLLAEILLLACYSFEPLRLKEKGLVGIITDALYAHVIPALLAGYTFLLITDKNWDGFGVWILFWAKWQLWLGCRNILFHQISDYSNDIQSKTKTFSTHYGIHFSQQMVKLFLILEVVSLGLVLIVCPFPYPFMGVLIFLFFSAFQVFRIKRKMLIQDTVLKQWVFHLLDDFYLEWMWFIPLIIICFHNILLVILIPVFFLLIPQNGVFSILRTLSQLIRK